MVGDLAVGDAAWTIHTTGIPTTTTVTIHHHLHLFQEHLKIPIPLMAHDHTATAHHLLFTELILGHDADPPHNEILLTAAFLESDHGDLQCHKVLLESVDFCLEEGFVGDCVDVLFGEVGVPLPSE